eukprot:7348088-Lingulodinium_polyedra.AAC.1
MAASSVGSEEAPLKKRRVSQAKAGELVAVLGESLLKQQQERDIEEIVKILRASPETILRCKAFLSSGLAKAGVRRFVRGVTTLESVPFKIQKEVLCDVCQWQLEDLVNLEDATKNCHYMFLWAAGVAPNW